MSPLDAAMVFATITQLLGMFMEERKGEKNLRKEQFLEWLQTHRHDELRELICNTHHLSERVDSVLQSNHTEVLQELKTANETLAQVMSRLQSFGPLVEVLIPDDKLSDFALDALCHFEDSGETNLITLPDGSGVQFGNSGGIEHDDPRFLSDDMDVLERCGFIKAISHHQSYSVYELTRRGASYARMVKKEEKPEKK